MFQSRRFGCLVLLGLISASGVHSARTLAQSNDEHLVGTIHQDPASLYFSRNDDRPAVSDYDPKWSRRSIYDVRVDIREKSEESPVDRSAEVNYGFGEWTHFAASPKMYAWFAPDICYQPLYFEDVALERYGQTFGPHRQTLRSGAHFFRAAFLWPHQMLHDSPCSFDSPYGFCRPGSATHLIYQRHYFGSPW